MNDRQRDAFRSLAKLVGSADLGLERSEKAQRRHEMVEEVCALVGQRHALTAKTVRYAPHDRNLHHIVMARSHAAEVLHNAGFSYAEIGRALAVNSTTARRMVLRWKDRVANRLDKVTEDEAHAVRDLIKAGMTEAEACDQVGVGVIKFQSREQVMRMEGKL